MVQQQLCWRFAGSMDVLKGCEALSGRERGGGNEGLRELQDLRTDGSRVTTTGSVVTNLRSVCVCVRVTAQHEWRRVNVCLYVSKSMCVLEIFFFF